jgi:hypothetical protein
LPDALYCGRPNKWHCERLDSIESDAAAAEDCAVPSAKFAAPLEAAHEEANGVDERLYGPAARWV